MTSMKFPGPDGEGYSAGAIQRWFSRLYNEHRYGGLSKRQQWLKLFDPAQDLENLPIGVFDLKAVIMPRRYIPESREALITLCRRMIDRRENEAHIQMVLQGWPAGWSLEHHVDELWRLREINPSFYANVVIGRHGRALRQALDSYCADFTLELARRVVTRHGLLFCAFDSQVTTVRARVSFLRPMGTYVSSILKVLKAGTVLKIMKAASITFRDVLESYQTSQEEAENGKPAEEPKPEGPLAKRLYRAAEDWYKRQGRKWQDMRTEVDEGVSLARHFLGRMNAQLNALSNWSTEISRSGSRWRLRRNNTLRHFHGLWYSGLTPAAGMSVSHFRYATAERELAGMVERASTRQSGANNPDLQDIDPLPVLPAEPERVVEIIERVADLAHTARMAQLQDPDWKSKTRKPLQLKVKHALAAEPSLNDRDPVDKAGFTFVRRAQRFLDDMGGRPRDAYVRRSGEDPRLLTYWHMDVVPELRLAERLPPGFLG